MRLATERPPPIILQSESPNAVSGEAETLLNLVSTPLPDVLFGGWLKNFVHDL